MRSDGSVRGSAVVGLLDGDRRTIPASHLDLVECPPVAALTTVMPDGSPQTSVVWCDVDGTHVRVIRARRVSLDAIHA
jgi:hypothetical protein